MSLIKLNKRNETKGISWEACLALGVEDTKYNFKRYQNGEALDLMADACTEQTDYLERVNNEK